MAISRVNVRWVLAVMLAFGLAIGATALRTKAEDKEKEENEVKVKFAEVPAAVQATLTKEGNGAKIETVDKETDDGKTVYEADVTLNGHNYEIRVAPDGTLISKKLDEEGEKGEKDGKGEKNEKGEKGEK